MTNPVSTVRLELFDGFQLMVDDHPVNALASAQRLLAFLALRGPIARVVVAGTLWGDVPEEQALASLRTTMWRCNRTVRGLVAVEQTRLALASRVGVDVTELVHNAAVVLDGARDGGRGLPVLRPMELLPGWYDDWVIFERERLRQLRLHALEAAVGLLVTTGQYAAALECALAAVRAEPLRESAHRAVITVHLAEHNVAEAVREYQKFRRLTVDELGIEPSEDLARLVFTGSRVLSRTGSVTLPETVG
jgi:DNA-binding SARP family transcriptional activator